MSESIIAVSGIQRGGETIDVNTRRAVAAAVREGAEDGFLIYQRKIALKTGAFRGATRDAIGSIVGRETFGKSKIVIPWSAIERLIVSDVRYSQYHIRGNPNQAFFGQYKDPTTKGTEPLNPRELMAIMRARIKALIPIKLKQAGLETNG